MKKLLILFAFVFSLTSCTFTEEITISPDGAGKYNLKMDGSSFMAMMPKDTTGTAKNIDSVFTFKEILAAKKDSIDKLPADQREKIKQLERFNMHMKMNHDSKEFLFSMATNFKSVSELQDVMNNLAEIQKMSKGGSQGNPMGDLGGFSGNGSKINYTYNGKKFTRKATVDKEALKKLDNDSLDSYKMIFESSKYVIKYNFPKAVKKVSNPNALFSEDKKTITIEYSFNEYLKEPEKLNFEVEFVK
ncbi:hypothetical protein NAT51_17585 [Flavobacterium amniphilum]|uniref:hypothetical protein n=1 Tax=Flavobacterium amniphilum TaxID=1834035 RepID=UPI00202ABB68|nr:hypothetical protein [Flavobacterium amniphilum]MCL9807344.1 hypothetical protein [Flavobacterium amniphilum]